jgi:RNA polymerase sigma factor (sigma-70 family)
MSAAESVALPVPLGRQHVSETFEEVFRRVLPRAVRVAERILGNGLQAEDAAAEAFARAHASWRKVGSSDYCDAWILRVTANVAVDMHRSRRRILSIGLSLSRSTDREAEPESRLQSVALGAALARLPRRQREVIVLRYLEDMSEVDVAKALGVSVGTVKKDGFRARETLRKTIGQDFDG